MSQFALYRSYRPQTFDEVVGQDQVVIPIKQAVKTQALSHAYLFKGMRGTGKTSVAKILARAANCLDPHDGNPCNVCTACQQILAGSLLDVQEIDAASNNSVDHIRSLIEDASYAPMSAKYKVYIIDEVHMLSTGAFNALLKTLEEPPAHVIFILATTDPQKIPPTIISRCQVYEFRSISLEEIKGRLRYIADQEGFAIEDAALTIIGRLSKGAMRDALTLLDQLKASQSADRPITPDDVLEVAGMMENTFNFQLTKALASGDPVNLLLLLEELQDSGRDLKRFTLAYLEYLTYLLKAAVLPDSGHRNEMIPMRDKDLQDLQHLTTLLSVDTLLQIIRHFAFLPGELRWSPLNMATVQTYFLLALSAIHDGSPIQATAQIQGSSVIRGGATLSVPKTQKKTKAAKAAGATKPQPEESAELEPEVEPEPAPEADAAAEPEKKAEPATEAELAAEPEKKADPAAVPEDKADPDTAAKAAPAPEAKAGKKN